MLQSHEFCPFSAHTSSLGQVGRDTARKGGSQGAGDQGGGLSSGGSPKMGFECILSPNNTCNQQPDDHHHSNELIRNGPKDRELPGPTKFIPIPGTLRGDSQREVASRLSPKEWSRRRSAGIYNGDQLCTL